MILILDTETTGTDETKHELIEVAGAMYDELYGLVACKSVIICAESNAAEHVNHIAPELLEHEGWPRHEPVEQLAREASECRAIVAHNAAFDRKWLPELRGPWVCSQRHIEWPNEQGRDVSLEKLALAHGVGVLPGHRAIYDVLTLVRVFDAVRAKSGAIVSLIDHAMRPKAVYAAKVTFGTNQLAKDAGFRWDAASKQWRLEIAKEDAVAKSAAWRFQIYKVEDVP